MLYFINSNYLILHCQINALFIHKNNLLKILNKSNIYAIYDILNKCIISDISAICYIFVISVMSDISDICDIDHWSRDELELTLRLGLSQHIHRLSKLHP
jgi:hypothetical protein